jgi:hypothetical protein
LSTRPIFRSVWWVSNVLLILAVMATVWCGVWEYSMRQYLKGFSDAVVPQAATPQQRVEATLRCMKNGPPRLELRNLNELSPHDPQNTLHYRQLLQVCGSATNAFLNLARSAGLDWRRLLLLTPERTTDHVVAEILVDGRWVIVDPTYRVILKDVHGNLVTRKDLQNPEIFHQATSVIPNYPPEYNYARFAHVRLAALPFQGAQLRRLLGYFLPSWDEYVDWGLLLERRSFFFLFLSGICLIASILVRMMLGWLADHRLQIPRFHLRTNLSRASAAFFSTPEIK